MAGQPPSSWSANPITVGFQHNSAITFTYGGTSPNTYYRTRVANDATRIFTADLGNGGTLTQTSTTSDDIIPVATSGSVTLNAQYSTSPTTGFTTAFTATFTRSAAVQPDVVITVGNYSVVFGNTAALSVSWTGASAPTEYAIWSVTAGAYVAGPTGSGGSSLSIPNANLPASGGATQTYRVDGKVSVANNGTNTYSAGPTFTITRNAEVLPVTGVTLTTSSFTLAAASTSGVTVSWTGQGATTAYNLYSNNLATIIAVDELNSTSRFVSYAEGETPGIGARWTYKVIARVSIANGGSNTYYDGPAFSISRLCDAPIVATQTFSTSPSSGITDSVELTSSGSGGTLEYAVNQSATAPTSGWTTTNSFSLTRGQNYYFWARQSNPGTPDLTAISTSVNQTVPYLAPDSDVVLNNVTVAYGNTSFITNITGGSTNTEYEIRSTSYTGTIRVNDRAGGAGNVFLTVSGGLPTQTPGDSVTFYVTCYRYVADGGEGFAGPRTNIGTFTVTRDQAPAYSFTNTFDVSPITIVSTFSQVTGITVPTAVSLIGGGLYTEFSVSSTTTPGTWQVAASTINGNQYLHIRDQSADSPSTDVVVNTRIGTASASVDRSWTIRTADDTMPNDFFFTDVTNADLNTYYTSYVQITGISVQVPITQLIMQGEYGVENTISPPAVYNNPISILPNQYIHARILSASSPSVTKNLSLRVGGGLGKTDTFSVTTSAIDTTPDPFFFTNVSPAVRSTDYYTYAQITGINSAAPVSRTAGTTASWATSATTTQPTSWPNPTVISPNNYLHLKVTSSANYATSLSNTMDVGGVSDAWVVTTAQATNLSPGTVSRSPAGDLVGSYSANLQVNWTGVANHEYRIYRTSQTPAVLAGPSSLGASTLSVSSPDLPAEGVTSSLQLEVRRPTAQSGDNIWYTTTGGTFTVLRIDEPTVANNQSFDVSTNTSSFIHPIQLSSNGVGGTLEYNATTTSPYPSTGWSGSNGFSVTRGTTYYFWARRSTDTSDFDVSEPLIIPPYTPIGTEVTTGTHGLRVYTSPGSILIDSNSRIGRVLAVGTTASVPAKTNSGNISVPTLDTSSNSHVIVTHPADSTDIIDPYVINVNYTNKTFNIYNNTTTAKTYNYFVLRTG